MNNLNDLGKSFSELCVISEYEKSLQGAIKWHIPELRIRNHLQKYSKGNYINSNWFSIGSPSYCSFYFHIQQEEIEAYHLTDPPKLFTDYTDIVCVYIVFCNKLPDFVWVKGKIHLEGIDVHRTFSVSAKEFDKKVEIPKLCRISELHKILYHTEGIVINCSMKIIERSVKCTFDKEITGYADSRNYDSTKDTFKPGTYSDVSITINGHLFKTHRVLLARIPYFQKLFEANKSKHCFELTNIEHEIFSHILTFLYSGDIPQLHFKLACELYVIAHDLKIFDLKCLCSSYLGANLTDVNVLMVLKLAHECKDIALKKECFKTLNKYDCDVLSAKIIVP